MKKFLILVFLFPIVTFAAVPRWQIIPDESSLTFIATQNDAPVSGKFTKFSGDISVDPDQLDASHVNIVVDIGSLSTSYQDLTDTLVAPDWFSVTIFPQATFVADKFTKTGDNTYSASGTLTIRDKTVPIILDVVQDEYSGESARVHGTTTLKRSDFGVGQGEWASTTEVKDEVQVNFTLSAVKK